MSEGYLAVAISPNHWGMRTFSRACLRISKLDTKFVYFYYYFYSFEQSFEFETRIGEGCLCRLCRNCLAVSFVSGVGRADCPPLLTPPRLSRERLPFVPGHITFNHPLGQPPTDHIQPPRYPLSVTRSPPLSFHSLRLGAVLERPRVRRSIYLNVLSRFVLITLPENAHTHTAAHTLSHTRSAYRGI